MAHSLDVDPLYRELTARDQTEFHDHLLRLSPDSRYSRFGHAVSDSFLETYSRSMPRLNIVACGAYLAGTLRAIAELRRVSEICPADGEIGLTVEDAWQDAGIGTELLLRVRAAAKVRGIETIHMICSRQNTRMRWVAQKVRARAKPLPNQLFGWDDEPGLDKAGGKRHGPCQHSDFVTFTLDI